MTDSFPIDIIYNDLITWLTERYLIPKDWPKRLEVIKQKNGEILEQIHNKEEKEFAKIKETFPRDAEFNYESAKKLEVMIKKTEEAKAKTLFGNYSSPIIQNLLLVISLYEKNNVFLCEYAKLIVQYVNYDIDSSEKNISYLEKSILDFNNKISDKDDLIKKSIEIIKQVSKNYYLKEDLSQKLNKFAEKISQEKAFETVNKTLLTDETNKLYKELSINLISRLSDLKGKLNSISESLKSNNILESINFYSEFYRVCASMSSTQTKNNNNNNVNSKSNKKGKGDIKQTQSLSSTDCSSLENMYTDFLREIKILNKLGDQVFEDSKIEEVYDLFKSNKPLSNNLMLDFYLDNKIKGYLKVFENVDNFKGYFLKINDYKISEAKDDTKKEYTSLLLNSENRIKLINNLNELKNFLLQRKIQSETSLEISFLLYVGELRELLSKYSNEKIDSFIAQIDKCLLLLEEPDFKFLLRLLESENAVVKIISQIDSGYENVIKHKEDVINLNKKIEEARMQINSNEKFKEDLKKELKNMKKMVDKTLTTNLKRKISVMGSKHLF